MITTLTGPNDFMRSQELNRRISEFVGQYGEMGLERLDGEEADYTQIGGALQSLPFLTPAKLVVLKSAGANKQFAENMPQLLGTIPTTNEVIIVEPKPDKRSSYYKQLKKLTMFKDYGVLDGNSLAKWLVTAAKQKGGNLTPADARLLIERLGADQLRLSNELEKLLAYDPKITSTTIKLLTEQAPQGTVFQLLDAAFKGNRSLTLKLYKSQRDQQVEPLEIVGLLAWQLHALAIVKTAGGKSFSVIAKESGLKPYTIEKTAAIANKVSLSSIKKLIADLHNLDVRIKTTNINADDALQYFLLTIY